MCRGPWPKLNRGVCLKEAGANLERRRGRCTPRLCRLCAPPHVRPDDPTHLGLGVRARELGALRGVKPPRPSSRPHPVDGSSSGAPLQRGARACHGRGSACGTSVTCCHGYGQEPSRVAVQTASEAVWMVLDHAEFSHLPALRPAGERRAGRLERTCPAAGRSRAAVPGASLCTGLARARDTRNIAALLANSRISRAICGGGRVIGL